MVLSDFDRTLRNRCLTGEEGAWESFIDRFLPLIVHVVHHTGRLRIGRLPDAWRDDLVAEVLLAIVEQDYAVLRRFQGQSSLGTYLVVIARRVASRKLSTMLSREPQPSKIVNLTPATGNGDVLHIERTEQIEALLVKLPTREAQAIRLFHLEHLSYFEIGNHLGIPENSVGPLLSQARSRMRSIDAGAE